MTGAIFGLIGVIVGGLLAAAVQSFRDWRSERRLGRAAARMLSYELSIQQSILARGAEGPTGPEGYELPEVADWPEYRAAMARALDDDAWGKVARAYANLVLWHCQNRPASETSQEKRLEMRELALEVELARGTLQAFRRGARGRQPID